ncbi:DUF2157 domain-containing protein [Chitinophaga silvatica]|uniref:DUF2157 domain-containing protein n=1 Tax=Chitinophaga silvatica TaxID=2282649 RepID=A0A3E1Y5C9_9BACT|nr:DUF2157 domain-containing protein [Chitinophaga silvatica]RFS19707.1 DUF2157 domain-containing protein [Chitinophaga silvatica]
MNQIPSEHQEQTELNSSQLQNFKSYASQPLFSLHWELKVILYLGVLLLSSGLGILIYENLDSISHQAILAAMALVTAGCFVYCYKQASPFSWQRVESPSPFFDYLLLLGCLTFISFIGYLQFAYNVFGTKYGLATAIPLIVLFFTAYYFDHLGVLSLAITNLAAWMGLTVTPLKILSSNDFSSDRIVYTGMVLGILLLALAIISERKQLKAHFAFTYRNFGVNIFYIACLAAIIERYNSSLLWAVVITLFFVYLWKLSHKIQSLYFLVISIIYEYIALVALFLIYVTQVIKDFAFIVFWLFASAVAVIIFLIYLSKKFKNDRLQ